MCNVYELPDGHWFHELEARDCGYTAAYLRKVEAIPKSRDIRDTADIDQCYEPVQLKAHSLIIDIEQRILINGLTCIERYHGLAGSPRIEVLVLSTQNRLQIRVLELSNQHTDIRHRWGVNRKLLAYKRLDPLLNVSEVALLTNLGYICRSLELAH